MALNISAAQALRLWHDVNLHMVRDDEPDLSVRQISILLTVYLEAPPHTVRDLARKLGVSKPVITREGKRRKKTAYESEMTPSMERGSIIGISGSMALRARRALEIIFLGSPGVRITT